MRIFSRSFFAALALTITTTAFGSLTPTFIKGDAVLKTAGKHNVYVYVQSQTSRGEKAVRDDDVRQPRGNIDQIFWLASAEPVGAPALLDLSNASIEVTANRVVIISAAARTVIVLALADGGDANEEFPADYNVLHFKGFGLSHKFGTAGKTLDEVRKFAPKPDCADPDDCFSPDNQPTDPYGTGAYPSCGSGGLGATSCSCSYGGSGCSATCSSGYFACCNCSIGSQTCQCVRQ